MTEDQIKHMVQRFLMWRLPDDFQPDDGISFQRVKNAGTMHEFRHAPIGTNLLTASQAEAMVRHMIEGCVRPMTDKPNDAVEVTAELLPCPFCGGNAAVEPRKPFDNITLWAVICTRCHTISAWRADKSEAISLWNTRLSTPPREQIEAAVAAESTKQVGKIEDVLTDLVNLAYSLGADGASYTELIKAARQLIDAAIREGASLPASGGEGE